MLILGTSDSGKSTICRHLKQLYGEKFNDQEKVLFKKKIRSSCLNAFVTILPKFLQEEGIPHVLHQQCDRFLDEWRYEATEMSKALERAFADAGIRIWRTSTFQKYVRSIANYKPLPRKRIKCLNAMAIIFP